MNKTQKISTVAISMCAATIGYFLGPAVAGNLKELFSNNLSAALSGAIAAILSVIGFEAKNNRIRTDDEQDYKRGILKKDDEIKAFVTATFSGLGQINLIMTDKDLSGLAPRQLAFMPMAANCANANETYEKTNAFLSLMSSVVNPAKPLFLFVNIGKYSFDEGIGTQLRSFKKQNPQAKIFLVCSVFYWEEVWHEIKLLIEEGIVEKTKLSEIMYGESRRDAFARQIQHSLAS